MRGGGSFEGRGGLVLIKKASGIGGGGGERAGNLCVQAINPFKGINLTVLGKKKKYIININIRYPAKNLHH